MWSASYTNGEYDVCRYKLQNFNLAYSCVYLVIKFVGVCWPNPSHRMAVVSTSTTCKYRQALHWRRKKVHKCTPESLTFGAYVHVTCTICCINSSLTVINGLFELFDLSVVSWLSKDAQSYRTFCVQPDQHLLLKKGVEKETVWKRSRHILTQKFCLSIPIGKQYLICCRLTFRLLKHWHVALKLIELKCGYYLLDVF